MEYTYHEGSQVQKPLEVDTVSSSTVVYLRRNIERISRKDPQTEETVELWGYEEAEITHEEYEQILTSAQAKDRSDIDFIAIMADIDLDE